MALTRARVDMKDISPHASYGERENAFKNMMRAFKKACGDAGIQHDYRKHEYHESPGEKRRRKMRESEVNRLKAKLKENFGTQVRKRENL